MNSGSEPQPVTGETEIPPADSRQVAEAGEATMSLRETLRRDFEACMAMDHLRPRGLRRTFDVLTQSGFLTVALFRVAHAAHLRGWFPVSRLLLLVMVALFSAEIYPQARIGPGFFIAHPMGVAIGAGTVIGSDVQVFKGVSIGTAGMRDPDRDGFPVIETGCKIFDGAKVFGPVTIGAHSRVGANVLLFNSVPARSTVSAPQGLVRNAHFATRTETSTGEGFEEVNTTWAP